MKKQTFGMLVASLRKQRGMTQLDLAAKMGVTDKAVSKWERDLSYPDVGSLPRLAEVFGISVDALMQVEPRAQTEEGKEKTARLIDLICRAVALAMGVALFVLSILKQIDLYSGFGMMGIGLACLAVSLLAKKETA